MKKNKKYQVYLIPVKDLISTQPRIWIKKMNEYREVDISDLRPISVCKQGKKYAIIDGHHRFAAVLRNEDDYIPAIILSESLSKYLIWSRASGRITVKTPIKKTLPKLLKC